MSQPPAWAAPTSTGQPPPAITAQSGARLGAAPRPGIVPLRPLNLGEIYDGAFQAVRTNPRAMLGFSAVVVLASTVALYAGVALGAAPLAVDLLSGDLTAVAGAPSAGSLLALAAGSVPGVVLSVVGAALLSGCLVLAVTDAVRGRRPRAGELWRRVRARLAALVGLGVALAVLTAVVVVGCLVPGVALLAVSAGGGGGIGAGVALLLLGGLAAAAGWIFLDVRLFMAAPALVLEGLGVVAAVRRSWALTRRRTWRLLGTRLLALVAITLLASIVAGPFQLVGQLLPVLLPTADAPLLVVAALVPLAIGQVLSGAVTYPLTAAVTSLQYVDQRMRLEGLDVELARSSAPVQPSSLPTQR